MRFAFECNADENIFSFLKKECEIQLEKVHQFGQGEVINSVFVRKEADIGMVDEDPDTTHHGLRDKMDIVSDSDFTQLRKSENCFLILIKPWLEKCFIKSFESLGEKSQLGGNPVVIRDMLSKRKHTENHAIFYNELKKMHQLSRQINKMTFLTEIESYFKTVILPGFDINN